MKLAAIDIGTNAIRLQIVNVYEEGKLVSFKKLEFLRFPLRLGQDVFTKKKITPKTIERFTKLMHAFKLLIDLYEVDNYIAVATSAMREAENGNEVRRKIKIELGLDINIIQGKREASILHKAIIPNLMNDYYIHIDVGGGSTELNLYDGKRLKKSQSFKIGSVRRMGAKQRKEIMADMKKWSQKAFTKKTKNIVGIGTGGNINKLFKIANKSNTNTIGLAELKALRAYVKAYSLEDRMKILKMNPDRADVIIPASEIYITVLENVGSDQIIVPKVGLKDGLIYDLYESTSGKKIEELAFL
jgi:exopolyphosphatase/guanosine-5'-triphosphate,3'-diphosphate pyrophosphatase